MSFLDKLHDIRTFVFDVDGVLTDGSVYVQENGVLLRKMSTRDGQALKMAVDKGYQVAIITGGRSQGVIERLKGLGIKDVYAGVLDKKPILEEYMHTYDLGFDQLLYMGDDLPDEPCLRLAHLPCCPSDAVPEIQAVAQYISPIQGGHGCVRDVIEKVLKVQGNWGL